MYVCNIELINKSCLRSKSIVSHRCQIINWYYLSNVNANSCLNRLSVDHECRFCVCVFLFFFSQSSICHARVLLFDSFSTYRIEVVSKDHVCPVATQMETTRKCIQHDLQILNRISKWPLSSPLHTCIICIFIYIAPVWTSSIWPQMCT